MDTPISPFHAGELAIQQRLGVQEQVGAFASKAIRRFMPDQHREFFAQLPFMVVGNVDAQGRPWASLLPGKPGFVQSPDDTTLSFSTGFPEADPVGQALVEGSSVGLLGIELPTRRRNRANGRVTAKTPQGFEIHVQQSFGNCPKYIQKRGLVLRPREALAVTAEQLTVLDDEARALLKRADTIFVATYLEASAEQPRMVDVSHRGGRPGFIKVEGGVLTVPDFIGNNMFCTLGNMLLNPRAGLVIPDFESGHMLQLTGSTEIVWDDEPEVASFTGANRLWRFKPEAGVWLRNALPFDATLEEISPFSMQTGQW